VKKRSGKEKRFAKDVNHCLSKAIVQTARIAALCHVGKNSRVAA
jgi:hypothetical protein